VCFNKSVFNWTFCQSLLCSKKNPIAQKYTPLAYYTLKLPIS
jgi:hypothetical protein